MTNSNINTLRLYNPKANAPAIYIPSWLSQIPNSELKYQCKLVYGRLAQWCTNQGKAHRSAKQLSEELGMPTRTVEKCLMELRNKKLIGCFQQTEGSHNHFEFYDHEWMYRPLNKHLCYLNNENTPSAQYAVPSAQCAVPSAQCAVHKIKEIKEIKDNNNIPDFSNTGKTKPIPDYKKDNRFMRFYSEYPKKEDPKDAYKAFKSIVGDDDVLLESIIADIKLRKQKHSKWQERQFIKYPAVYLRKGEYLGEIFNIAEENEEKDRSKKEENENRMLEQEKQSQLSAEREKAELEQIQIDGRAFRAIKHKIKSSGVRPAGLKNLRESLGLK